MASSRDASSVILKTPRPFSSINPVPCRHRTGRDVSVISLGTWQLGADWGDVSEEDALAVLEAQDTAAGDARP